MKHVRPASRPWQRVYELAETRRLDGGAGAPTSAAGLIAAATRLASSSSSAREPSAAAAAAASFEVDCAPLALQDSAAARALYLKARVTALYLTCLRPVFCFFFGFVFFCFLLKRAQGASRRVLLFLCFFFFSPVASPAQRAPPLSSECSGRCITCVSRSLPIGVRLGQRVACRCTRRLWRRQTARRQRPCGGRRRRLRHVTRRYPSSKTTRTEDWERDCTEGKKKRRANVYRLTAEGGERRVRCMARVEVVGSGGGGRVAEHE